MGGVVGLDDVIVGAGVEQFDDQALVITRRRDDHRHLAGRTDHAQEPIAGYVRQPKVQDHGLGVLSEHQLQAG